MRYLGTKTKKEKLYGIPKLEDANWAGSKDRSPECTLILTQGDSAKSFAMNGLQVVGRDKFGVFPLKGKLLNVRDSSVKRISDNDELQNLMKIMGLQMGKKYITREDLETLRYGGILIMADQDQDGSHIKGLLINFIHFFWPDLIMRHKEFLKGFITPIIKVTKKKE
jgi:DNA topoisomerase II